MHPDPTAPAAPPPPSLWTVAALFFASGAAGLVYEVTWSRRLELTFGTSTYAVGVVLAAYMSGLGLGAWLLGPLSDRPGSPARRYALLEVGIGVYGLLAPWVLDAAEWLYAASGGAGGLFIKALLGLVVLLPPTFLMGGTLPVLARALVRAREDAQGAVGLLYGLNTLGAVAGTLLAGLVLLSWLGLDMASRATGVFNLLLGGLAWTLGPRLVPDLPAAAPEPAAPEPAAPEPADATGELERMRLRVGLLASAGCGAVALLLEVAWTRSLSLALGASGHSFTMMLAATLLGIGLGSALVTRLRKDARATWSRLALALLLLGAASATYLLGYTLLPRLVLTVAQSKVLYYEQFLAFCFLLATAALLPATTALGLAFPLCTQLATPAAGVAGRSVGRLYLANTAGALLGSLGGGFLFLDLAGADGLVRVGVLGGALGAGAVAWLAGRLGQWEPGPSRAVTGLAAALVLVGLTAPRWDPLVLDMDPIRTERTPPPPEPGGARERFTSGGLALRYSREGLNAHVTVRQTGPLVTIRLGGKPDASTIGDMPTQLLCGVIPLLAHPQAQRALVIGVGSGVTARVVADSPSMQHVTVVELEEAVIEAAREWFGSVNHGVLDRPEVHLALEDARSFLLASGEQYDVIVSEPTNPWIAGVANLFSKEHYDHGRARLAPDGVYLQWVQLYASEEAMARSMVRTFVESFEYVDCWMGMSTDLLMVGSRRPLRYDLKQIQTLVDGSPGLRRDLGPYLLCRAPEELLGRYLLPGPQLAELIGPGPILSDGRPLLEGQAARARYEQLGTSALRSSLWAQVLAREPTWPELVEGQSLDPAAHNLARADALRWTDPIVARAFLERAPAGPRRAVLSADLSQEPGAELAILSEAAAQWPEDRELTVALANAQLVRGDREAAAASLARVPRDDAQLSALEALVRAQLLDPRLPRDAEQLAELIRLGLTRVPPHLPTLGLRSALLGCLSGAASVADAAFATLVGLYQEEPADPELGLRVADVLLDRRRPAEALELLDEMDALCHTQWSWRPRLLRLRALRDLDPFGARIRAELARFVADFPAHSDVPDLRNLVRSLR